MMVAAVGVKYGWHLLSLLEAKPNKAKESATLLKVYASLLLLSCGQHVLTAYSYHAMWPKEFHYPKVLARYAEKHYDRDYMETEQVAEVVESVLDVMVLAALAVPAFLMNRFLAMEREVQDMRTRAPATAKARALEAERMDREAEHQQALARAREMEKEMAKINETRKRK